MKKKNGFTLIELLAVVVILGVIMTVAAVSVSGVRKNANTEAAKKLEKSITDLGPQIYSYEMSLSTSDFKSKNGPFKITLGELKEAGYLKTETLKIGNTKCSGFLIIDNESMEFKGYIDCGEDIYISPDYDTVENGEYAQLILTHE